MNACIPCFKQDAIAAELKCAASLTTSNTMTGFAPICPALTRITSVLYTIVQTAPAKAPVVDAAMKHLSIMYYCCHVMHMVSFIKQEATDISGILTVTKYRGTFSLP